MSTGHITAVLTLAAAATLALAPAATSDSAHATIINVPADEPSIQAGIGASSPGDTVLVAPDTYHETIDFAGRQVVVASLYLTTGDEGYIHNTVLDGGDVSGPLASFTSGEDSLSMLVGLTLQNGRAMQGGAIYCQSSAPRVTRCFFTSNSAQNDGGAIYAAGASPIVEDCVFSGNEAQYMSGGAFGVRLGSPRIAGCVFSMNEANDTGGAIFCEDSFPVITDNVIENNLSWVTYAGGIMSRDCAAVIARNAFAENVTYGIGGGLFY